MDDLEKEVSLEIKLHRAEKRARADERAKIRAWASREAEDVGIDLYRADLLKFLDSLDSPSKGEKE